MSLESRISKTVVEYIDTAITSPPSHYPLQDADHVYDSFVKDFARLSTGIDMKQVYERKPDDPAYLPFADSFAINLARLFLAFREREQVPSAFRPKPEPLLSLDSVDLAKVTAKTFKRVLFLIANANERAHYSKPQRNDPAFDRAYERFDQTMHNFLALPYVKGPGDPHWLVRYSSKAINIVRAMVAIQAQLESETAIVDPSQPVPVPSLDSVNLNDVTHEQFLDILGACTEKLTAHRYRDPPAPAPPSTQTRRPTRDVESGSDTCCDPDTDGEGPGDWGSESDHEDDYDEDDDDDESSDCDVSTDDVGEIVPRSELLDDSSEFDSEEDYQAAFKEWEENEADEPLPQDVVGPLLDSADAATRSFTIDLLQEVLGVAKAPIAEMKKNIEVALRELRRLYRIDHTPPWKHSSGGDYERTLTPFIESYLILADAAYMMRSFPMVAFDQGEDMDNIKDAMMVALGETRKSLRRVPTSMGGIPECQKIMKERARIARIRLSAYFDTVMHVSQFMDKFEKAFAVVGPRRTAKFQVKHHYGLDLYTAIQNFRGFDESRLGVEYFPEFPAALIKCSRILDSLDKVYGLKFIAEFRTNDDMKKAANTAGELLYKWHQRSLHSRNSLFVVLQ